MVRKYARYETEDPKQIFIKTLKGKLGEESVKSCLGNLVEPVNYDVLSGGDGGVDLRLTTNPKVGIQVKATHNTIDVARWSISEKEKKLNTVLVCVLIKEEIEDDQPEFHLILAGFLPTSLIEGDKVGINQLLYGGGLRSYLEFLYTQLSQQSVKSDDNSDTLERKVSVERPKLKKQQILEIRNPSFRGKSFSQPSLNPPTTLTMPNRPTNSIQSKAAVEVIHKTQSSEQLVDANSNPTDDELRSDRGIHYTKLRDLLAAGKWNEADWETLALMLKVSQREDEGWLKATTQVKDFKEFREKFPCLCPGWLRVKDIRNFPCTDLSTIDQLWVKYSDGRFGFSVQKRIYETISRGELFNIDETFCKRVEWRPENSQTPVWLHYVFSLDAPEGHLPGNSDWWGSRGGGQPKRLSYFLHRLSTCGIGLTEFKNNSDGIPW
ncbi:GUN4 domain-containing protein [Trichocoleus sp. ST-U3]